MSRLRSLSLLLLAGCVGAVSGAPSPDDVPGPGKPEGPSPPRDPQKPDDPPPPMMMKPADPPLACEAGALGPSPLFLLSRAEYDNTVADLLGDTSRLASSSFVREDEVAGFHSTAAATATTALFDQYLQAAEKLADNALKRLPAVLGCDRTKEGDATCAASFIERFASRAFRRPATAEERMRLQALFAKEPSFEEGIRVVIAAALQSPSFLYRIEAGTGAGKPGALTGHELASRLSYFLWDTMPDAELLRAADARELDDPAKLRAQAERMLGNARASAVMQDFFLQWLLLSDVPPPARDAKEFPLYSIGAFQAMQRATGVFLDYVLRYGGGTLEAMLTSPVGFADAKLLPIYGAPPAAALDPKYQLPRNWTAHTLDAATRSGLLTQHSLLTVLSTSKQPNPIRRGAFVKEHLLCDPLPPPPPDVDTSLKEAPAARTFREVIQQHSSDPKCKACHELTDPLGFPFDRYDAMGQYRERDEAGQIIDVAGTLDGVRFEGVKGLAQRLVATDRVGACVVKQWFRYAFGRGEGELDRCLLRDLEERLRRSRGDVRGLVLDIVTSTAFRHLGVAQ